VTRFIVAIIAAALGSAPAPGAGPSSRVSVQGPQITLWTDRDYGTVYHRGERVRLYFRTDEDAYVTVIRVDTDGRLRVLFPLDPWEDNFARGGRAYEVRRPYERYAFVVDEYPGEGYVFALATRDPFDYRALVRGDHWDYRAIADAGRIAGDPYVALQDFADLIVPAAYDAYGYDVVTYYVEQYYEYPRFLCYDCHAYAPFPSWNPYHDACLRFRIVIYDDPYYYPARVYSAARVVYRREGRIEARYVFKDRSSADPFVVRMRQRPPATESRRLEEPPTAAPPAGVPGTLPGARPTPLDVRRGLVSPAPGAAGFDRRPESPARPPAGEPGNLLRRPETESPAPPQGAAGAVPRDPTRALGRPPTPQGWAEPKREPQGVPQPPRRLGEPGGTPNPRPVEPERPRLERRVPPELPATPRAEPPRSPERRVPAPESRPEVKAPAKKVPPPPKPKGGA
jgi:hypothetical protein